MDSGSTARWVAIGILSIPLALCCCVIPILSRDDDEVTPNYIGSFWSTALTEPDLNSFVNCRLEENSVYVIDPLRDVAFGYRYKSDYFLVKATASELNQTPSAERRFFIGDKNRLFSTFGMRSPERVQQPADAYFFRKVQ